MSAKDLIPLNERSPDERREIARKGAAASNAVQRIALLSLIQEYLKNRIA